MNDWAILQDWMAFGVRWLHVVTAIAWIGSSFYFIALDLGLRRDRPLPQGVTGEEWQVHGGGFYHVRKYAVAPDELPEHLTWFKWESYSTWASGFALLVLVYWFGAELYLIDPNVADLSTFSAILISAGSLVLGWVVYDKLCKSRLGRDQTRLMLALFGVIVAMAWFYAQVFSGRAALLHLGAFTATIMTTNVAHIIIPNQRKVVAALKAKQEPEPALGAQAKQRSLHNNYLTLPVLFLMLSNHAPLAFATENNWIIASLVFLMGVLIRHFFNTWHARKPAPTWTWLASAVVFILLVWLSTAPLRLAPEAQAAEPSGATLRMMEAEGFEAAAGIVLGRCSMCHSAEPVWPGLVSPPNGVVLETEAQIAREARRIYLQAGVTHAMPPGNRTWMEEAERAAIRDWWRGAGED